MFSTAKNDCLMLYVSDLLLQSSECAMSGSFHAKSMQWKNVSFVLLA